MLRCLRRSSADLGFDRFRLFGGFLGGPFEPRKAEQSLDVSPSVWARKLRVESCHVLLLGKYGALEDLPGHAQLSGNSLCSTGSA